MNKPISRIALFPLTSILSLLLPHGVSADPADELAEVKKQQEAVNAKIRKLSDEYRDLQQRMSQDQLKDTDQLREQIAEINAYVTLLGQAAKGLERSISLWRKECRKSFIGMDLGNLTLSDGRLVVSGKVVEVKDASLLVAHDGTQEDIAYELLPETVRLKVIHDETVLMRDQKIQKQK